MWRKFKQIEGLGFKEIGEDGFKRDPKANEKTCDRLRLPIICTAIFLTILLILELIDILKLHTQL